MPNPFAKAMFQHSASDAFKSMAANGGAQAAEAALPRAIPALNQAQQAARQSMYSSFMPRGKFGNDRNSPIITDQGDTMKKTAYDLGVQDALLQCGLKLANFGGGMPPGMGGGAPQGGGLPGMDQGGGGVEEILAQMSPEELEQLLAGMPPEESAPAMAQMPEPDLASMLSQVPPEVLQQILASGASMGGGADGGAGGGMPPGAGGGMPPEMAGGMPGGEEEAEGGGEGSPFGGGKKTPKKDSKGGKDDKKDKKDKPEKKDKK